MDWPELKRRLQKEGTSVQILADLEGVTYKTMYNRIMHHQQKEGVKYLTPENTRSGPKKKTAPNKPAFTPWDEITAERPEEKQDIPEEVYTGARDLMPETIEEINNMYYTCKQLAERYQKQAEDWRRIMEMCAEWSNKSRNFRKV